MATTVLTKSNRAETINQPWVHGNTTGGLPTTGAVLSTTGGVMLVGGGLTWKQTSAGATTGGVGNYFPVVCGDGVTRYVPLYTSHT